MIDEQADYLAEALKAHGRIALLSLQFAEQILALAHFCSQHPFFFRSLSMHQRCISGHFVTR